MTILQLPSKHPLPLRLRRMAGSSAPWSSAFIPDAAKQFVTNGRLKTTRENLIFLVEQNIEPDNGQLKVYHSGPELKKLAKEYGVTFFHSPKHILSPFKLVYFDPRGHPLADSIREELAKKARDEPLWIQCTSIMSKTSAVVHTKAKRRLAAAIHKALAYRGYSLAPGKAANKSLWGTLYTKINDPIKACAKPLDRLAAAIAEAIDKNWPRRVDDKKARRDSRPINKYDEGSANSK
ncbi:hypothetical protein CP533_6832 [Ophiocordyceps camponoti-saundersi (nom. inval.)]|nr:hypothetical protein CP533_6832 [Ophiocordyceps camponoti-saundersi (nom. inval.)]